MMKGWFEHCKKMADIFFNGRRSGDPKPGSVNWPELIRCGDSIVKYDGKRYLVTVQEVTFTECTAE